MMEELIKKAKIVGFESKFLYNKPYKYSSLEPLRRLFWLTELRQHIFVNWFAYVGVSYRRDGTFEFTISDEGGREFQKDSNMSYITEAEALQAGIELYLQNV